MTQAANSTQTDLDDTKSQVAGIEQTLALMTKLSGAWCNWTPLRRLALRTRNARLNDKADTTIPSNYPRVKEQPNESWQT
jgi:hypothetical protein